MRTSKSSLLAALIAALVSLSRPVRRLSLLSLPLARILRSSRPITPMRFVRLGSLISSTPFRTDDPVVLHKEEVRMHLRPRMAFCMSAMLTTLLLIPAVGQARPLHHLAKLPHVSKQQAKHDLARVNAHKSERIRPGKVKAHKSVDIIVCGADAGCGNQGITTNFCLGGSNGRLDSSSCNGGTSLAWLGDGYVAGDSIAQWTTSFCQTCLFDPITGVQITGFQPRVLTRNGSTVQRVAIAWGNEGKYGGSEWTRWYWAYASALNADGTGGVLVPFHVGSDPNTWYYAQDTLTGAGVKELFYPKTFTRSGNAYRLKLAIAWYNNSGQISTPTKVYPVPILKSFGYWYWGLNNIYYDGTVAP